MRNLFIVMVIGVVGLGCGKKDEAGGDETAAAKPDEGSEAKKAEPPKAEAPDFSAWNADEKKAAWEGSWLVKENGRIQAWTVASGKVQTWDGKADKSFELEMEAPCRAIFKNDKGMKFPRNFSVVDGKVRYRGMGAGFKKGAEAIYCDGSGAIYVLDGASACTVWENDFGKWKKATGECGFKKNAEGAEVFHHPDPNGGEFAIEGDAILSKASFETEKVEGDHAAAKAARDAKDAAK